MKEKVHLRVPTPFMLEGSSRPATTCITVLTTPRSGSSAFAGVLYRLGCSMGAPLKRNYYENIGIGEIHSEIYHACEVHHLRFDKNPLPDHWPDHFRVGTAMKIVMEQFMDRQVSAMKDVHLIYFWKAWRNVLERCGVRMAIVRMRRPPMECVRSYERYYGLPLDICIRAHGEHLGYLEAATDHEPIIDVSYGDLMNNWRAVVQAIAETFEIRWPNKPSAVASSIDRWLDPERKHFHDDETMDIDTLASQDSVIL